MDENIRNAGRLHSALIRGLIATGRAPTRSGIERDLGWSQADYDGAIDALAAGHGVVLHPGTRDVWVVHPFSLAPTGFAVRSQGHVWWGNCAWCSLGVAVLVDAPCTITTTLGAEGEQVQLTVAGGRVEPAGFVVHFPVPMTRAWDNVIYTCSTMLLFRDEAQVDRWCERHGLPKGDVQPVARALELAKRWYGGHARPDWVKTSVAEARALFAGLGLTHPVWALPAGEGRF